MNILHFNTTDISGGAGIAMYRLHHGLRKLGHNSQILVHKKYSSDPNAKPIRMAGRYNVLIERVARYTTKKLNLQYLYYPSKYWVYKDPWVNSANILHLHNTHGNYFSHTSLPYLSRLAPLVWTLHDMWSLTGHCSYSFDCDRWEIGCGDCPDLDIYPSLSRDTTKFLWQIKKLVYQRSSITFVTPSLWLYNLAKSSPLINRFEIDCIPNGLDTSVYRPVSKILALESLKLAKDRDYILYLAHDLNDFRKGGDLFVEALAKVAANSKLRPAVLLVGKGSLRWKDELPFDVIEIGPVSDDETMRNCYAAASVFVLPSRQDNFPNTLLESLACGTPCVAFNVGGVSEIINHMETGYLVSSITSEGLAQGLEYVLSHEVVRTKMSLVCRETAVREYSNEKQAQRYQNLYQKIRMERLNL